MMFIHSNLINVCKLKNGLRRYMLDRFFSEQQMEPALFEIFLPQWGSKTLALILHLATGQRLFVRLYRPWQRPEAEKNKAITQLLMDNGVSVPRLLGYADMPKRYYSIISVEEYVESTPVVPEHYTPELAARLATQLAKLHSIRAPRWGQPPEPSGRSGFGSYIIRHVLNRVSRIQQHRVLGAIPNRKELIAQLRQWKNELNLIPQYNLTHDKIPGRNVILSPDGRLFFIDFPTAYYSFFAKDLVSFHHRFCSDDEEKIEVFNAAYFASMLPEDKTRFERLHPFYDAWFHLSRCAENANAAQKCFRAGEGYGREYQKKSQEHWETASCILKEHPPRQG
ncbi:MAG TPA: aminoglycoside phosphotransferase family protein [bacterium]|nr:aminoglycoside phosphotransferase family protein [bacterium]